MQKTADFPQLHFIKVVVFLVVTPRLISIVLVTIEIPQLLFDTVVNAPILQIFPVVLQRPIPMVQTVRRTTGIPQFFFDKVIDAPVAHVVQIIPVRGRFP